MKVSIGNTIRKSKYLAYDPWLIIAALGIILVGLTMVASSSIVIGNKLYHQPFYFLIRQTVYLGLGTILGLFVIQVPVYVWREISPYLLLFAIFLLVLVLIPGVGREVNGSQRWLGFGPLRLQVSELAKLCLVLYTSSYIVRRREELQSTFLGFMKPLLVVGLVVLLLLKEPDFGAAVVIIMTCLGMLFLGGVRMLPFIGLSSMAVVSIFAIAIAAPYRFQRLTTFLNPWQYQFDSGYQLTQSLIAFGRGGLTGMGLGESVQKMFYLPEAHTDFLFAVAAEELGLFGALMILGLFYLLLFRIFLIARRALLVGAYFSAFMAYGFAFWVGLQATINIGVNSGILPTKGLTLPFMSFGGSSIMVSCILFAMLLRVDFETRQRKYSKVGI